MIAQKVTTWVHHLLLPYVKRGNVLIDGTCGNGLDTLFLAQNSPTTAKVIGIDIQGRAIENTEKLLEESQLISKVSLVQRNHLDIESWLKEARFDVGMLNLGYLPHGDKQITTEAENTVLTLKKWLVRLRLHGALSVTCYPGHEEGQAEYQQVADFLKSLSGKYFQVLRLDGWNRESAPIPFLIERIKEETR
jgi:Predicted O-methyltransferase